MPFLCARVGLPFEVAKISSLHWRGALQLRVAKHVTWGISATAYYLSLLSSDHKKVSMICSVPCARVGWFHVAIPKSLSSCLEVFLSSWSISWRSLLISWWFSSKIIPRAGVTFHFFCPLSGNLVVLNDSIPSRQSESFGTSWRESRSFCIP